MFAAYNAGYGAVLTSISRYNTNDYWELCRHESGLPWESSIYVPKIMAAAIVGHNLEAFGFADLTPDPPFVFDRVEAPPGHHAGRDRARRRDAPRGDRVAEPAPGARPHPARSRAGRCADSGRYRRGVRRGVRARPLVRRPCRHRRASLRRDASTRWRARAAWRRASCASSTASRTAPSCAPASPSSCPGAPPSPRPAAEPAEKTEADGQPTDGDTPDDDQTIVAVPDRVFSYEGRERVFYRTRDGDSIEEIAETFAVLPDDLIEWNNLDPTAKLQPRLILQIYVRKDFDPAGVLLLDPAKVRVVTLGSEEFLELETARRGKKRVFYTAKVGDSLAKVGRRYGLTAGDLARINRFSYNTELHEGQKIVVYSPTGDAPREVTMGLTPEGKRADAKRSPGTLPHGKSSSLVAKGGGASGSASGSANGSAAKAASKPAKPAAKKK